jgi:hypothetical protein
MTRRFDLWLALVVAVTVLAACQAGSAPATATGAPSITDQPVIKGSATAGATGPENPGEASRSPLPITRDRAVAIARVLGVHTETSPLVSATAGPFQDFDAAPGGKVAELPNAWVWAVKFRVSNSTDAFVILDYYTGALVETGLAKP